MPEDPVYRGNVDKIGLLGTDAADTVQFYMNLTACRVNLRAFVTGEMKDFPIEKRIEWVETLAAIWSPTKELGESLINRLLPRYTSLWDRLLSLRSQ